MEQCRPALGWQPSRRAADDLGPQRKMTDQPALLGDPKLRSIAELACLSHVMDERGGHQQVRVESRVKLADLADEGADGDRVLDQAAHVRVVAGPRARGPAELGRDRLREENPLDDPSERLVVDLPCQVLEKPLELLGVPVGGGQEFGWIELALGDGLDVVDLGDSSPRKRSTLPPTWIASPRSNGWRGGPPP